MRRLARWTLRTLTVLSLLLCVAIGTFWCIDRNTTASRELMVDVPHVTHEGHGVAFGLFVFDDYLFAGRFLAPGGASQAWGGWCATDHRWSTGLYCLSFLAERDGIWRHLGGFGYTTFAGRPPGELFYGATILMLPLWLLLAVTGLPPAVAAFQVIQRHRRRTRTGHCPSCSYDLTANVSGVCPECGTAIPNPRTSSPGQIHAAAPDSP